MMFKISMFAILTQKVFTFCCSERRKVLGDRTLAVKGLMHIRFVHQILTRIQGLEVLDGNASLLLL